MSANSHKETLKSAGLHTTQPRLVILNLLYSEENSISHFSAEDLYEAVKAQGDKIGIATIYRIIQDFVAAGIFSKLPFEKDENSLFELNVMEHHDHLQCVKCNKVEEFVDNKIEKQQQKVADSFEFELVDHSLTIYGICSKCQ